ncbi:hypothetical protein [Shewanella baltica]|uniref:hypothetical protein n=1 Tax=Shewanella baltica TaxID=62322 RepID=UPI00217D7FA0|nr:hypothetical protein [Shewanella baltica]MCS6191930.1 hypothetical protein [Shewanella baltica]
MSPAKALGFFMPCGFRFKVVFYNKRLLMFSSVFPINVIIPNDEASLFGEESSLFGNCSGYTQALMNL